MARPIEPTPILRGKDAEEFYKSLENAKYDKNKVEFLRECVEIYKKMRCD